ncbi:NAD-dependent epimerase/dehydratase family protein [Roseiconus lacunae]|uniref:SDR family NAD(P)-dependent oxidoreductase n=1 Tax=Roseiconus lacunae TaxID=2605694 RepID=A0ABT7PML1_9BACT|nr:NAD-dependent epimerase/dehydratase family protein [Roseiconus lacunae]MDM4017745.1 SDR family NAD(P)-dependent oxidoreductase [Roseiconus lacunae]
MASHCSREAIKGENVMENGVRDHQKDVLVVGTGYLGNRVAQLSQRLGYRVFATTRRLNRLDELKGRGFHPILLDWNDSRMFEGAGIVSAESSSRDDSSQVADAVSLIDQSFSPELRVLVAVSYDSQSPYSRYESQVLGLRRLLRFLPKDARISYVSTTGVYHQTDGVWVDETSTTRPSREAARVHLQAEQELHRRRPSGMNLVLRLAGIYGPGRVPRVADVVSKVPIATVPDSYVNLIHVEDAARACVRSWDYWDETADRSPSMQRRLFLVADDRPVTRGDFYRRVARLSGVPEPEFVAPDSQTTPRRRAETNKRICNAKMRRHLIQKLNYPDYREGLVSALH